MKGVFSAGDGTFDLVGLTAHEAQYLMACMGWVSDSQITDGELDNGQVYNDLFQALNRKKINPHGYHKTRDKNYTHPQLKS